MRRRASRPLVFLVVTAACAGLGAAYVVFAIERADAPETDAAIPAGAGGAPRTTLAGVGGRIVFQDLRRDATYAGLAVADLTKGSAGPRVTTGLICERAYTTGRRGLCLIPHRGGIGWSYEARIFDAGFRVTKTVRLPGLLSRARVSADGRFGATTGFVTGHSYADKKFSTYTAIIDMPRGKLIADLERFTTVHDGKEIDRPDVNYWGVSFTKGDGFYATLRTGGETYLVKGDVSERRMEVVHEGVECPSLSPDGARVAFKKANGQASWRLHVLDLQTMRETALAETRSVDDQVEWLDDDSLLYGLDADVWTVAADGTGSPQKLLPDALSPAVVHRT